MKKLLTFLTLLTLSIGVTWAETVTDLWNAAKGDLGSSNSGQTGTITTTDGKTWSYSRSSTVYASWQSTALAIQLGSSSGAEDVTFTTSAYGTATIKSVSVECASYQGAHNLSISVGGNSYYSGSTPVWSNNTTGIKTGTGNSSGEIKIEFTDGSKALYIKSISVTYDVSGTQTCAIPTFSPDGGTFYEPQTVTLSSTTEGATIYYTKDGSTPDPATSQSVANNGTVTIDETCTLTAIATATGYDPSNSYSKLFTINTPETVEVPPTYEEPFSTEFGKFYTKNVLGINVWSLDASYNYAKASGYSGGATAAEGWLISPYIDLTGATNPELSFSHAGNYFNSTANMQSDVKVKVRVLNQTGWSDWSDLTINTWPTGANWTFVDNTTSLADYAGKTIQIAFQYTSSANRAGTWEIKNFKVENAGTFEIFRHYKTLGADNNNADGWMGYWGGGATLPNGDDYADYTVQAESGTTVSFLIGHNNGNYQLLPSNITIVDANGNPVENLVISAVNEHGQTPVSFTMPASNVDITANFTYYRPTVRLAGHFNGRTGDNWVNDAAGPQFTYNATNDEYSIDAYFVGADDNGARDYFFLFLDNNANHPSSGNYPITSVNGEEMTFGLGGGDSNNFSIAPGVYNIKINGAFNKMYVTKIQDPTISFTPAAGEVVAGTPVSATSTLTDIIEDIQNNDEWALGEVAVQVSTDNSNFADNVVINEAATVYAKASIGNIVYTATANYTIKEVSGDEYTLVTNVDDIDDDCNYVIVTSETHNDKYYAMGAYSSGSCARAEDFVIIGNKVIVTGDDVEVFHLTGDATNGWAIKTSTGAYLKNGSSAAFATENTPSNYWNISFEGDLAKIIYGGSTSRCILYSKNNSYFRNYATSNFDNTDYITVKLYKKSSSTPSNKSEAPVITPEATTIVGGKVNVTITAADGAAIYYTTTVGQTGTTPDVEDDDQLYTEAFDLTHTGGYKTVTAIAVENGKEPSDPVSKTYLFTSPEAPTFTPDPSEIQPGDFTVTINTNPDYVGAVIYYLLDPTTAPNGANDVKDNGLVYNAETGVPVTGHGQHTIYAIVDLNGIKSSVATATYTIFSEGDEGDWKLVTKIADIDEGREYIIVNSDRDRTVGQFNPVLTSGYFSSLECTNSVLFGPGYSTATVAGNDVTIFTFEKDGDNLYMKSGETYYTPSTSSSDINMTKSNVYVTIDNGFVLIKGSNETTRSFAYNYQNSLHYFSSYSNPTTNGNQRPVYMYYREAEPVEEPIELTLAEIITLGDEADGKLYKISDADGLLGVYKNGTSVWFTDEKRAVDYQDPMAANYKYYTVVEKDDQGNVLSSTSEKNFHQYNWIEVVFPSEKNFTNKYVRNMTGTYSCENGNPKLELTVSVDEENDVTEVTSTGLAYELNPYMAANFEGTQDGTFQGETSTYFFSQPKAQEYAKILWAKWDGEKFIMPTENNAYEFTGSFTIDLQYNITDNPNLVANNSYNFEAIIRKSASKADSYKVYPTNLQGIPTAINGVVVNGEVKSIKYVNVAGMVSDVPFQGVNIVVTEYTDGSRTTSKMLRK